MRLHQAFTLDRSSTSYRSGAGDWTLDAACTQVPADLWFPEQGGSPRAAKRICGTCTVTIPCLQEALDNDERYGVWGGLSTRDRDRIGKRRTG